MFGGSVASLAVLGDPDITLITLTELCEQMRRMSRAAELPVLVDADHGYGNALNVRRTVQELETAGAAGLTIEDTLLPQAFGEAEAAVDLAGGGRRQDEGRARRPQRSVAGHHRPHRARRRSRVDSTMRSSAPRPMRPPASMRCSSPASRRAPSSRRSRPRRSCRSCSATRRRRLDDLAYLAGQRVRIALQGHAPFAAATQAVYETLKALREGTAPKNLKGLASSDLTARVMRDGRCESAQRRISWTEKVSHAILPGHDPRPGAGRRLSRLGRGSGAG